MGVKRTDKAIILPTTDDSASSNESAVLPVVLSSNEENTIMESPILPVVLPESAVLPDAPIIPSINEEKKKVKTRSRKPKNPVVAPVVLPDAPIVNQVLDESTIVNPVVAQKTIKRIVITRNGHDRDVAFFDKILARRHDIARYVMPEYKACPDYWTPSVKRKVGESVSEHITRDYNAWLKSYARALIDRKVTRIGDIFFYPAKITPGAYVTLIRENRRAYVLAYSAKLLDIFGTDAQAQIVSLIGTEIKYPVVSDVMEDARSYHRAKNRKDVIESDVNAAYDRFCASFDIACAALQAIDTNPDGDETPA